MKVELPQIAITNGQRTTMAFPEFVQGVRGEATVVVADEALAPGEHAYINITYEITVRGPGEDR